MWNFYFSCFSVCSSHLTVWLGVLIIYYLRLENFWVIDRNQYEQEKLIEIYKEQAPLT